MNRLTTRLVLRHLLVVVIGALVTYAVVRELAPRLFDMSQLGRMGRGGGQGQALRQQFASAVDRAVLVGALAGAVAAALAGIVAAVRLVRPINGLRAASRSIAEGRYAAPIPKPRDRELAELAADLGSLANSLADTESRRLRLLGEVAHEMRTPLTVIDGYVEGMIDGVLPTTETELGQVSAEVRRLRRLADDLSALSRADEGRLRLVLADVDLHDVVREAATRLRGQATECDIELTVDPGATALPARVDADRIAQVVTNLVGNALRAVQSGGRIGVRCARAGSDAVVVVTDSGAGIDAADLERIFERFYRIPGHRPPDAASGHGIGLTISRAIARAHRGDLVGASPGPGRGATFTLTVPLRDGR
ncbi:MAG: HAMP domain-containing sensor histidine kinase [Tetrasphaera sp.]